MTAFSSAVAAYIVVGVILWGYAAILLVQASGAKRER